MILADDARREFLLAPADESIAAGYARSRHYDPTTGRFMTLDPAPGSNRSPLSLHKYTYVHDNPIMGIDPLGLFFTLVGQTITTSIKAIVRSPRFVAIAKAYDTADTLSDAITIVSQLAATGTVNPLILAGLLANVLPFGSLLSQGAIVGKKLTGAAGPLTDALKGFKRTGGRIDSKAVELIGSLGAIGTAKKLGFEAVDNFPTRYRGFDGIFMDGNRFIIVEAKGGAGRLGTTIASGGQLSQRWIRSHVEKLRKRGFTTWADRLKEAIDNKRVSALLVSTPVDRAAEVVGDPSFVLKAWDNIGPDIF